MRDPELDHARHPKGQANECILRTTRFWLLGTVATAALAGTAYATIPAGDGAIHGCYAKSGGTLRVVDAAVTSCKAGETALD